MLTHLYLRTLFSYSHNPQKHPKRQQTQNRSHKPEMIFSNYLFPPPFSLRTTCRKRFTPEEDERLRALCNNSEAKNWEEVARHMPGRTARQCRDRYNVSLKNFVEKKPWTKEEDEAIVEKYHQIGPKWVTIASFLVGRSGNNVKNRWHKHINKDKIFAPFVPIETFDPDQTCDMKTSDDVKESVDVPMANEEKSRFNLVKIESKPQDCLKPYLNSNEKFDEKSNEYSALRTFDNANSFTTNTPTNDCSNMSNEVNTSDLFLEMIEIEPSECFYSNRSGLSVFDFLDNVY
ncbi:hypothetical protein TRFO_41271 [Tritrichomonas foetus]|uniref:Myb-like DNA-binding domain containing protein n=1 Tax=Tritrichomonas foetus TaxID=1144522 RepID=A0A1J4L253_9EUKA|nr:hypothetical protein TRFO_41271 [Tritrichomonas foetus]|eukprot:OHT17160.1 hypothetical protein TRFO_41271 [Tritrichomonas foetus]